MFGPKATNKLVGHSKFGHHETKIAGSSMNFQQLVIEIFLLGAWLPATHLQATLLVNLHGNSRPFAYRDARTEQAMSARAAEAESKAKRAR